MPILRQRVVALLRSRPGEPLCVSCVAQHLGVRHKNAHEAMLKLEAHRGFHRAYGQCSTCGKTRMVSGVSAGGPGGAPARTPDEVDSP
jgi:ribosomal protein L34E